MWVDEEAKANELKQQNNLVNPSVGAGGGGNAPTTDNTDSGTSGTQSQTTPQTTQKFATAQDYIKANQPQAEELGQKFTGALDESYTNQKGAIDTAANKTLGDVNAGVTNYNADLTNTAIKDPTKITNDPNQLKGFLNQYNASYTGPNSFETTANYDEANKAANEAQQTAGQLGSEGGRGQLIQDKFGVYGQGNKNLDTALLQHSSAEPTIQNQQKQFSSVQDYLKGKSADVSTAAQKAAADTAAAKKQTQDAFANNLTNFQTELGGRVKAAQDTATAQANTYTNALKSGDAKQMTEALKSANLTDAQKANLIDYLSALNKDYGANVDLSNFYTMNPATDINAANVASKADYDKAAAYKQLTGVDYGGVLNPADIEKAGTMANANTGIDATNADTALRNYLIQKEIEALQPKTAANTGSSSQPKGPSTAQKLEKIAGPVAAVTNPIGAATMIGGAIGVNKLVNSISNTFGGGKKDAQVNLPELKMPELAVPKTANAATTKAIVDVYNKPMNTQGSYHEGAAYDMLDRLGVLRTALQQGQISADEYNAYALPLAKWTWSAMQSIAGASSAAANSINGGISTFQQKGFLNPAKQQDSFSATNPKPQVMRAF